MTSVQCVDILICSLLVMAIVGFSKAELEQTKTRRATYGLYPSPRVGRSDPTLNINNLHKADVNAENAAAAAVAALDILYPTSSFDEYEEYPKSDVKSAGMVVYPRYSDAEVRKWARLLASQKSLDKRAGPSATTGVWFGPRLGKRSVDNQQFDKSSGQKEEY
ncbi:cardio acceleratory peptide 2b-like [Calliphora vicina]|uniref:cardio acceleratory peptide 2b-like n=1 Tax=Calliphora vicina TaxID=7373 RepID=UPI00325A94CB